MRLRLVLLPLIPLRRYLHGLWHWKTTVGEGAHEDRADRLSDTRPHAKPAAPQPQRYCKPFRRGYFRHTIHSGQSRADITAVRRPSLAQGRLLSFWAHRLVSRQESRSLSELTRQITPPTKNGHAPPPIESRKSYQSVNPTYVWTWWVFQCWVKLSHRIHILWCPSVNSFKFQPCDHTPPGTQTLWFLIRFWQSHINICQPLADIV